MEPQIIRAIIVCALGYFIDVFDIQLFAVLRVPSLTDLGVPADKLAVVGGNILNAQMLGMVLGGFLWGWLGDRFGRLKSLYGSILIYSLGTLACSFAPDPLIYGALRFITGFGLAGEVGAAITLLAELMPPLKRGWGIVIAAGFGFLGPAAAVISSWFIEWRTSYIIAGVLGLLLLVLRIKLSEPELFRKVAANQNKGGSWTLLAQRKQGVSFLYCFMIGLPIMYGWILLNFFSMEFSHAVLKQGETFNQKVCLLAFYIGTSFGDVLCGTLSQIWKSRRKAMASILLLGLVTAALFLIYGPYAKITALALYIIYFFLGIAAGGWILFIMITPEHFGTNIRATTAIVVSNLGRGLSIPMIFSFQWLQEFMNDTNAAAVLGVLFYIAAFAALRKLNETHGLDLDYIEKYE